MSDTVFVVRPTGFGPNPQTAATNPFQRAAADGRARALVEHAALVEALRGAGVRVLVAEAPDVPAPDAVFPNNWVSFHEDGTVVLYPLLAPLRRAERRWAVVEDLIERAGFALRRCLDWTHHEREGRFLEATGSLVLDRARRIAYAAGSPRTDRGLAEAWAEALGYELVWFATVGHVYHTNVVLSIGVQFAVVADEVIASPDRERVLARLGNGREVIRISAAAMAAFAANVLELEAEDGRRVLAASEAGWAFLSAERGRLGVDEVVAVPFGSIEAIGGGGVRCALAEVPRTEGEPARS